MAMTAKFSLSAPSTLSFIYPPDLLFLHLNFLVRPGMHPFSSFIDFLGVASVSRGYYDLGLFPGAIPVDSLPVWFFSGCVTSGEFPDLSAPQLFHLCYGGSNSICLVG